MIQDTLYVAQTDDGCGQGLFTSVDIKKGKAIFIWNGTEKKGKFNWRVGKRWLQIGWDKWISPFKNTPGYYINHSCNPNTGIKNSVVTTAMKDIKSGQEVTMDYSTDVGSIDDEWFMTCHCGQKNCRGIIRSYKYLPARLKAKYRDFTPKFLLEETQK